MLLGLKRQVWKANLNLARYQLVTLTWGNVSAIDRKKGVVAIKPSGLSYKELKPSDIVLVDLNGKIMEGRLNPSSDTPSHLELYKGFEEIFAVAHTHSEYATIFAQANMEILCLGTTHADHFKGTIPLTRMITRREVEEDYERNTGKVIVERFKDLEPLNMPAVLVPGHGAFTWGRTPDEAVKNSLALEKAAKMAWGTLFLNPQIRKLPEYLLQKHYQRKHGPKAYYGQKRSKNEKHP